MEKAVIIAVLFLSPGIVLAQEGFEADRMQACLTGSGLAHACYPEDQAQGLLFGMATNWAHHVLKLQDSEGETWLVKDRVTVSTAGAYRFSNGLQLGMGMDWIAHQDGDATDSKGAPMGLGTGIGRTWIKSSLDLNIGRSLLARIETGLVFPSPNPSILGAPGHPRWSMGLRLGARWWFVHPVFAIGASFGENQNFRDITRDNSIYWDTGLEVSSPDWWWGVFAETFGITRMSAAFSSKSNNYIESLLGAKMKLPGEVEIVLGLSMGITGPGAPLLRPMFLVRIIPKKIILENE